MSREHQTIDQPAGEPIVLEEIDLYVTMKCNLQCDFCSVSANEHEAQELPLDRLLQVIAEAARLGLKELHFSGGEPTLRDDLEDMLAFANELGLHTRIITNGFKLPRARLQGLIDRGLRDIMISIDGFEQTHNEFRKNRFSFQRAMQVVRDSVDLGLRTRVSTVAYRENRHEVVPLLRMLAGEGIHIYSAFLGSPLGRGRHHRMGSILDPGQWRAICEDLRRASIEDAPNVEVIMEQGFQYQDGPVVDRAQLKGRGTGCATLLDSYDFLILRADGNLYQCVFFVVDGMPIGNVARMGLEDALRQARHQARYRAFTVPQDECRRCDYQEPCGTGCRGYAYLYKGDWLKTDPRCAKHGTGAPATYPLCPILKVNAATGQFGGSSEHVLVRY